MIHFDSLSKQYGSTILLENATFSFSEKERTGLIGCNGSGKSTLLRMITGEEQSDKGNIAVPSGLSIGYLPQEVEVYRKKTALEIVLQPFEHLLSFEEQIASITENHGNDDHDSLLNKIDHLHTQMEIHDAYSLHSRAEAILAGLGLTEQQWLRPVEQLSGGYRMRAVLGRLLLKAPDFLLLDEPTNHLDMDSLVWLEKYLLRIKSGMLIVSHDRDFLNRITTFTASIENGQVTVARGNYDQFQCMKKEMEAQEAGRLKNLNLQIAQTERFIERFKAKASKATQAQSRVKQLEKLKAELPTASVNDTSRSIRFSFTAPLPSGNVPLQLERISAGYHRSSIVLDDVSLSVQRGDKIAVIGPNGSGKTTLLKLVYGILPPLSGTIDIGNNVSMRYFGQHQLDQLVPEMTVYDTVAKESSRTEKLYIRNLLGSFLFGNDTVDKTVSVLSGGEKARLVLATILASPGNVLLLDEPTNHLDISSIEMLADAMISFSGTILFVSHDEYFISRVANRIIEMRPGTFRDFPGTLDDYRYYLEKVFNDDAGATDPEVSSRKTSADELKEQRIQERETRKRLQRSIEKYEREIAEKEKEIERLDAILHNPANACNHELLSVTSIDCAAIKHELEMLLQVWESTHIELEQL